MVVIEMILMACLFGVIVTVQKKKVCTSSSWMQILFFMTICSFSGFWTMNMGRVLLLRANALYPYSQDVRLLFCDLLMGIIGGILFPKLLPEAYNIENKKNYITFGCTMVILIGWLIYQYCISRNIIGAIYHTILPSAVIGIAFAGWIASSIFFRVYYKERRMVEISKDVRQDRKVTVLVSFFFVFTFWLFPFLETMVTNSGEFSFGVWDILITFIIFLMIVLIGVFLFIFMMRDKAWKIVIGVFFAFTLAVYIQILLLNKKLFLLDGEDRTWTNGVKLANILIWCIVFGIIFTIQHYCQEWRKYFSFCCIMIVAMQTVGMFSLIIGKHEIFQESEYFSDEGLYEIADENMIIFVLDRFDEKCMEEILNIDPDFLSPLEGFTYFPDTVAQFSCTYPAITYMLTGKTFFEVPQDMKYSDWAFDNCSFWSNMIQQDWNLYFYEDDVSNIGGSVKKKASNYIEQGKCVEKELSFVGTIRSIYMMNCFRCMPYIIKDYYSYTAETINSSVVKYRMYEKTPYIADDAQIKSGLIKQGLVKNDESKIFKFIHMHGAHGPYSLDRYGQRVNKSTRIEQCMGSMQIVYDFLEALKSAGTYENSTIVITADHGDNFYDEHLPVRSSIILFIKPKGTTSYELQYSDVYASQSDLIPTLACLNNIDRGGMEGENIFTDEIDFTERERIYYYHIFDGVTPIKTRTYLIHGSALNFENWIETNEYHEFRENEHN